MNLGPLGPLCGDMVVRSWEGTFRQCLRIGYIHLYGGNRASTVLAGRQSFWSSEISNPPTLRPSHYSVDTVPPRYPMQAHKLLVPLGA